MDSPGKELTPALGTASAAAPPQALAERLRVLEWALEHFSQGVLAVAADGQVLVWNERVVDLLEVPRQMLAQGTTVRELVRWQLEHGVFSAVAQPDDQRWLRDAEGLLAGRVDLPRSANHYLRERRDGRVVEVVAYLAPDGAQVRTFADVTERVRFQQTLERSEARFRAMADAAPAYIWESDANGQPVWFNQRWLQAVGCTLEQALQEPWTKRLHPDGLAMPEAVFAEVVRRGAPFELEVRLLTADGHELWLADHGIPQHDVQGRFRGYIVYGWDVTARKAAERNLIQARDEAERANRAKSEFLSRMSHELRTPLNAVQGFAQLIESEARARGDDALADRVQYILRGGRHLLTLINEVLDLARIESGTLPVQMDAVALEQVFDGVRHLLEPLARERQVKLWQPEPGEHPATPTLIRVDPTRYRQIMLNLVSNAIKYNRPGGEVRLRRRNVGERVRIEVVDTGPGLTPAQCARLFRAFERLDADASAVEGAGIGLALSKALVERMHGRIGVDSTPGEGSIFWVEFERAQNPGEAPATATAAPELRLAPRADGRPHRVLYVEDNPVNQLLMQGMLGRLPALELRMPDRPDLALALVPQWRPDLLLLDIQLPGMDGCELLQRLRQSPHLASVPAVAVSANAMSDDVRRARAAGFDHYLTKPLILDELLAVVVRLLQQGRAPQPPAGN